MHMQWKSLVGALAMAGSASWGQAIETGGQVRLQWTQAQAAALGPVAQANALQSGLVAQPDSGASLETELRASGHGLTAVATLQQQRWEARTVDGRAWMNELYASHDADSWQLSAGKKIVGWDVGYGFRPNDMVQQENRRTLVGTTLEGRPLLLAEHFDASAAWSFVAVNPTGDRHDLGAKEPALLARYYRRSGAADWYGFARSADRTGASMGAAVAWVADESLELHGSVRHAARMDGTAFSSPASALTSSNPWQAQVQEGVTQALLGATWTNADQISVLAELWWDGSAASDAQWDAWSERNQQLAALTNHGAPAAAVAGNLAWQTQAFGAASSLRRSNVLLRLSWQNGAWQPALDVLFTPADQGRIVTASLTWQGDRVQVQAGVRANGGPENAVIAQLPVRSTAYVMASWSF
jgi:hypothetical protein